MKLKLQVFVVLNSIIVFNNSKKSMAQNVSRSLQVNEADERKIAPNRANLHDLLNQVEADGVPLAESNLENFPGLLSLPNLEDKEYKEDFKHHDGFQENAIVKEFPAYDNSGRVFQEQELESQAINVLHPRNRKFPPTQLLAKTHNPMTVGNEIPSKNANASRHNGATTNERQLSHESENLHLIQNSNRNDEIQKQARFELNDEMRTSFEEFKTYMKYLTEKQKEKQAETPDGQTSYQSTLRGQHQKEHQLTHQGSYEPVPYHVYQQQQYTSPFESRANPQIEKGRDVYTDVRRRPTLNNLSPSEAANVNTPQELLDHCCKFPACYDPLYELCIDTCRKCETDYPVTSWLPCPALLNIPDCTSNTLNGQLGRLPLACFPDIGPFANIMPVSNVMKMPSYHRQNKLDLSGRTKEGLAVIDEGSRTEAGVYNEHYFDDILPEMTRYNEPTRREQEYRRSMQARNRKFCNEEGICQSEKRNYWHGK